MCCEQMNHSVVVDLDFSTKLLDDICDDICEGDNLRLLFFFFRDASENIPGRLYLVPAGTSNRLYL